MEQSWKICWIKCNSLIDNGSEDKKEKGTKQCVIKRKLKFKNYKNCLEATQFEHKTNCKENIDIIKKL